MTKRIIALLFLLVLLLSSLYGCLFFKDTPLNQSELIGFWGYITEGTQQFPIGFVGFEFREDGTGIQYTKNYSGLMQLYGYTDDGEHPITYSVKGSELTITYHDIEPFDKMTKKVKIYENTLGIWMPFELTGGPTLYFNRYGSIEYNDGICTAIDMSGARTDYSLNTTQGELKSSWVNTWDETKQFEEPFYAFTFEHRYEEDGFAEFYSNAPPLTEELYHTRMKYKLKDDILTLSLESDATAISRFRVASESGKLELIYLDEQGGVKPDCTINLGAKFGELPIPGVMYRTGETPSIVTEYELTGCWGDGFDDEIRAFTFNGNGHGTMVFKNCYGITGQFPMTYRIERLNHVMVIWQFEGREIEWNFELKIDPKRMDIRLIDTKGVFKNNISWFLTFDRDFEIPS